MELNKPKVLIITDWYFPGYKAGGPIQSIHRLANQLKDDLDLMIITRDRDLQSEVKYSGIKLDAWFAQNGYQVLYCSKEQELDFIRKELERNSFDKIYLNSFFSLRYSLYPLFLAYRMGVLKKIVLAPRGMLGEGALKIKALRKRALISVFKLFRIHKKIVFHSTDKSETSSIKNVFHGRINVAEIGNFPVKVSDQKHAPKTGEAKFVFASRISPKKNLHFLLRILFGTNFDLSVYGAIDDNQYEVQCRKYLTDYVSLNDAITPEDLMKVFHEKHFFILPTLNENFGHAIIEALACGCPVIISDQTPWNDLESFGAGWVISLVDEDRWRSVINMANVMDKADYLRMSERAKEYVSTKFNFDELRQQYLNLFSE